MIWGYNTIGEWFRWTLGITFANGAVMTLSALAAALLPYRAAKVYEASPGVEYKLGNTPMVTVIGGLGFLLGAFMVGSFLFVENLGLAASINGWFPYYIVLGTAVFGLLVYLVMRQVRAERRPQGRIRVPGDPAGVSDRRRSRTGRGRRPRPFRSEPAPMTDRARVVVIGGGVAGCSVALHLARAGWTDLLLFDKGELTSGSTAHAAGLVTMFNPSPTMASFRRYSIELYRELGVFDTVGSLRIASSRESSRRICDAGSLEPTASAWRSSCCLRRRPCV